MNGTDKKAQKVLAKHLFIVVIIGVGIVCSTIPVYAHPGGTDNNGCHTCRTGCEQYNIAQGEQHCHQKKEQSDTDETNTDSQETLQCERWLQETLTTQGGFQKVIANIKHIVATNAYDWIETSGISDLLRLLPPTKKPDLQITNILAEPIQGNGIYPWAITVRNTTNKDKALVVVVRWLDSNDSTKVFDTRKDLTIGANQQRHFSGYTTIKSNIAHTISALTATIIYRDLHNTTTRTVPIKNNSKPQTK